MVPKSKQTYIFWKFYFFLYFQVRTHYMKNVAEKIEIDLAFQLGVLEMKRFFNNMPQVALDKKSNLDFIE